MANSIHRPGSNLLTETSHVHTYADLIPVVRLPYSKLDPQDPHAQMVAFHIQCMEKAANTIENMRKKLAERLEQYEDGMSARDMELVLDILEGLTDVEEDGVDMWKACVAMVDEGWQDCRCPAHKDLKASTLEAETERGQEITHDILEPGFAGPDGGHNVSPLEEDSGTNSVGAPPTKPSETQRGRYQFYPHPPWIVSQTTQAGSPKRLRRDTRHILRPGCMHVSNAPAPPPSPSAVGAGTSLGGRYNLEDIPRERISGNRAGNQPHQLKHMSSVANAASDNSSHAQVDGLLKKLRADLHRDVGSIEKQSERSREEVQGEKSARLRDFGERGARVHESPPSQHPRSCQDSVRLEHLTPRTAEPAIPYVYVSLPANFTFPIHDAYHYFITLKSPASVFHFPGGATRAQLMHVLLDPLPNRWSEEISGLCENFNIIHLRSADNEWNLKKAILELDRPTISILHRGNSLHARRGLWDTVSQGDTYIVSNPDIRFHNLEGGEVSAHQPSWQPQMRGGGDIPHPFWSDPWSQAVLPAWFTIPRFHDGAHAITLPRSSTVLHFPRGAPRDRLHEYLAHRSFVPRRHDAVNHHYHPLHVLEVSTPEALRALMIAMFVREPEIRKFGYGYWDQWSHRNGGNTFILSPVAAWSHGPVEVPLENGDGEIGLVEEENSYVSHNEFIGHAAELGEAATLVEGSTGVAGMIGEWGEAVDMYDDADGSLQSHGGVGLHNPLDEATEISDCINQRVLPTMRGGGGSARLEKKIAQWEPQSETPEQFTWVSEADIRNIHPVKLLREYKKLSRKAEKLQLKLQMKDDQVDTYFGNAVYWCDQATAAVDRSNALRSELDDLRDEYEEIKEGAIRAIAAANQVIETLEDELRHAEQRTQPETEPVVHAKETYTLEKSLELPSAEKKDTWEEFAGMSDLRGGAGSSSQLDVPDQEKRTSEGDALKRIPSDWKEWKGLPSPSHVPKGTGDPNLGSRSYQEPSANSITATGFYFFPSVSTVALLSDPMHFFQWSVPVTLPQIRDFLRDRKEKNIEDRAEFVRIREILEIREELNLPDPDVSSGRMVLVNIPERADPALSIARKTKHEKAAWERIDPEPSKSVTDLKAELDAVNVRRRRRGLSNVSLGLEGHSDSEPEHSRYRDIGHIINMMNDEVDSEDEYKPPFNSDGSCSCWECHLEDHFGLPSKESQNPQDCQCRKSGQGAPSRGGDPRSMYSCFFSRKAMPQSTANDVHMPPVQRGCTEGGRPCQSWTGHIDGRNNRCIYCHLYMSELEPPENTPCSDYPSGSNDSFVSVHREDAVPSPSHSLYAMTPSSTDNEDVGLFMADSYPFKVCTNPYACPPVDKTSGIDGHATEEASFDCPLPSVSFASPASPAQSTRSSLDCVVGRKGTFLDVQSETARDWFHILAETNTEISNDCLTSFEELSRLSERIEEVELSLSAKPSQILKDRSAQSEEARWDLAERTARMETLVKECIRLARKVQVEREVLKEEHGTTSAHQSCDKAKQSSQVTRYDIKAPPPTPVEQAPKTQQKRKCTKRFKHRPTTPVEAGPSRPPVYPPRKQEEGLYEALGEYACAQSVRMKTTADDALQHRRAGIWIN